MILLALALLSVAARASDPVDDRNVSPTPEDQSSGLKAVRRWCASMVAIAGQVWDQLTLFGDFPFPVRDSVTLGGIFELTFPKPHHGLPRGWLYRFKDLKHEWLYYVPATPEGEPQRNINLAIVIFTQLPDKDGIYLVRDLTVQPGIDEKVAGKFMLENAFYMKSRMKRIAIALTLPANDKGNPHELAAHLQRDFDHNPASVKTRSEYRIAEAVGFSKIDIEHSGVVRDETHPENGNFVLYLSK